MKHIAKDKPTVARKFKSDIFKELKEIPKMPFKNRKSIFFNQDEIRDLTFKGYVIVYKINETNKTIEVFGFTKWENDPFH